MKLNKEKIEELKAAYPEGIYEGEIIFNDENGKPHNVEFIYRKPTIVDGEFYAKAFQKSVAVANLNFIQSLIIFPEPVQIIDQLRNYPSAYACFVNEVLGPFFGANFSAKSRKL